MAEKTITDVIEELKGVETSVKAVREAIKNPPKSAADEERQQEAKSAADAERGIFQGIYDTLSKGFGAATTGDKKQGGLIAGLLGGVGAGIGKGRRGRAVASWAGLEEGWRCGVGGSVWDLVLGAGFVSLV